jgi:hypothetical protein
VQQIASGVQPAQVFDALLTALAVHADAGYVVRGGAFTQTQVGGTAP